MFDTAQTHLRTRLLFATDAILQLLPMGNNDYKTKAKTVYFHQMFTWNIFYLDYNRRSVLHSINYLE